MIINFSAPSSTVLQDVAGSVKMISGQKNFSMYLLFNSNRQKISISMKSSVEIQFTLMTIYSSACFSFDWHASWKHLRFFHSHEFWSTSKLLSVVIAEVISGLCAKGWKDFLYILLQTSTLQVREALSALHSFGLHAITLGAKPTPSGIFSCFKWRK